MTKILYSLIFIIAIYFAFKFFLASLAWTFGSLLVVIALVGGLYLYIKLLLKKTDKKP